MFKKLFHTVSKQTSDKNTYKIEIRLKSIVYFLIFYLDFNIFICGVNSWPTTRT